MTLSLSQAQLTAGAGGAVSLPGSAGAAGGGQPQLPQALQNLQRILQSQLAQVSPIQLQQAIQRQRVRAYSPTYHCFTYDTRSTYDLRTSKLWAYLEMKKRIFFKNTM